MWFFLCGRGFQFPQLHGDFCIIVGAHGGQEQRHTPATVRCLTKCAIHLSWRDNGLVIRRPHPVDSGMDVLVRDMLAMANDHDDKTCWGLLEDRVGIVQGVGPFDANTI